MADELLLQTLQRIESKVDAIPTAMQAHGERVAKLEVRVERLEEDSRWDTVKDWGKHVLTFLSGILTHLGLTRVGVKI
jgi:hypothetical protein